MCSSSVDGWRLVGDWPTWKQLEMPSAAQEHDIRVYCPVMDTLGAMGKAGSTLHRAIESAPGGSVKCWSNLLHQQLLPTFSIVFPT